MKMHFLLMVIAIPVVFSQDPIDYCTIKKCDPGTHTLCLYGIDDISWEECSSEVISYTISEDEQDKIIGLHNYFRDLVYGGYEVRGSNGPQPMGRNPTKLVWDHEIAKSAQVWAQQCLPEVDECRNDPRFLVNQNVGSARGPTKGDADIERILWKWYNEVERFNASIVSEYSEPPVYFSRTNHYTQLVWERTQFVGCGKIIHYDQVEYKMMLVCNYGPAGNEDGIPVYTIK